MARIRTIKPEFWDSPDTARASLRARLLYIAMWNLADDYGIGDGNYKRIIGFAFPNDEIGVTEIPRLIAEVSSTFSVMFFDHEGRPYYWIPSWEDHQRTEKRAKQRVPFPENAETLEYQGKTGGDGKSAESLGDTGAGTGEQGNRGTGERELGNPCPIPSDDPKPKPDETGDFIEFYIAYPRHEGRGTAAKAYTKALKKTDPATLLAAAERYANDPNREAQYTKLPATWLNAESWDDEPLPPRAGQQRLTSSQVRLGQGLSLIEQSRAEMATQLELGA